MTTSVMAKRKLYRNSETIYCAVSLHECWKLFEADMGITRAEEEEHDPFERIPDREYLDVASEEPYEVPGERHVAVRQKSGVMSGYWWKLERTAAEWAKDFGRSGHFSGGD